MRKPRKTANDEGKALREKGQKWLDRIEASAKVEKKWLDDAKKAQDAYTGEGQSQAAGTVYVSDGQYDFNILYANVETIVPAVINSAPVPDIRRRFADQDPVARFVAELLERAIRVQIDDSRLQTEMEASAQDAFLAGRGVVRIRFYSDIVGGEPTKEDIEDAADQANGEDRDTEVSVDRSEVGDEGYAGGSDDGNREDGSLPERGLGDNGGPPIEPERLENERICFEAVSWIDYRHGPAKRWDERPWEAFRFSIAREDESKSFDSGMIGLQLSASEINRRNKDDNELCGWEVWDKDKREVVFIDDGGVVLKTIDDPLGLSKFFCTPTPMQPIEVNGRLMPVNPFSVYRRMADDLDDAVRRKNVLIKAMKAKGWYGTSEKDLQAVIDLNDNEFAPIADAEIWAQSPGGLQNAIIFWPIEKFIAAIQQVDAAINTYKQWIYEITGISDIVRGASSASETATAQNIKSQWGSLRIQKMQRMMERCARDLFILMSEIIPTKFSMQTLEEMTGMDLLPKPTDTPQQTQFKQQVYALMKRKLALFYRIDVESDSTVRADLTRQKQEVAQFLQGAGQYFSAVGPLVQSGTLPADAALEIFIANARLFNLGRSVEDTLENMVTQAKAKAQKAENEPQAPNPEIVKAQAEGEADKRRNETELAKSKMDNDTEWKKAILAALAQIETARIQAATNMDSATLTAFLEGVLGINQMAHEQTLASVGQQQQPIQPPMPQGQPVVQFQPQLVPGAVAS